MRKVILGIDPSVTSTGYAMLYPSVEPIFGKLKPPAKLKGCERLSWLGNAVNSFLEGKNGNNVVACVEAPFMSMKNGKTSIILAGWQAVLRTQLWRAGIDVYTCPPKTLKMFITGNGNADKTEIISSVNNIWKIPVVGNDEADACGLAIMLEFKLGLRQRMNNHPLNAERTRKCLEDLILEAGKKL